MKNLKRNIIFYDDEFHINVYISDGLNIFTFFDEKETIFLNFNNKYLDVLDKIFTSIEDIFDLWNEFTER